jgi:hypothetical protein
MNFKSCLDNYQVLKGLHKNVLCSKFMECCLACSGYSLTIHRNLLTLEIETAYSEAKLLFTIT